MRRRGRKAMDQANTRAHDARVLRAVRLFSDAGKPRHFRAVRTATPVETACDGWHVVVETDIGPLGVIVKASIHRQALESNHNLDTTAVVLVHDNATDAAALFEMRLPINDAYGAMRLEHEADALREEAAE